MDDFGTFFVVLLLILVIVALFVGIGVTIRIDSLCVQNGWPDSYVTWDLRGYCIRWEAGTQCVEPLFEVLEGGE